MVSKSGANCPVSQIISILRPPSQWRSVRTTNAIERLHEEFKRRIKTQTVLPPPIQPPCCSGRCLLAARSTCAKSMAGKPSPHRPSISQLTSRLDPIPSVFRRLRRAKFQPHSGRHLPRKSLSQIRGHPGNVGLDARRSRAVPRERSHPAIAIRPGSPHTPRGNHLQSAAAAASMIGSSAAPAIADAYQDCATLHRDRRGLSGMGGAVL
jgi:hypothetical protein